MTVEQAQAAHDAAKSRVEALNAELVTAKFKLAAAIDELQDSKVRADDVLPRARIVRHNWHLRDGKRSETVVIIKRTAKQITVRQPGQDYEFVFRQDRSGKWSQYPKPRGFQSTTIKLELDE